MMKLRELPGRCWRKIRATALRCWWVFRALIAAIASLDTRPLELATGTLSLWFAVALAWPWEYGVKNGPVPSLLWACVALIGGTMKISGTLATFLPVVPTWSFEARKRGLQIGALFWFVLSGTILITAKGGITWGGFALLSAWQLQCLYAMRERPVYVPKS